MYYVTVIAFSHHVSVVTCFIHIIIIIIIIRKLHSSVKIGFMDDLTLSGDLHTVDRYITTIMESSSETGLQLNVNKCEIITDDFTEISTLATFIDFIRVNKEDMTVLGSRP